MRMPPILSSLLLAGLAACRKEPGFDERYDETSARITQSAAQIDAQAVGSAAPPTESEPQ